MDDDDDILNLVSSTRTKRRREISDSDDSDSSSQNEVAPKRRKGRHADASSDDEPKGRRGRGATDSDDDEDDYESTNRKKSSSKSRTASKKKTSSAASKSRNKKTTVDDDDDDVEFSDQEDDDDVAAVRKKLNQYDEQGYGDDEDRERLQAMTEVEREAILADRLEERQRLLEHLEVQERLGRAQGLDARRSSRKVQHKHSKGLSELKSSKERKSTKSSSEGRQRRKSAYDSDEDSGDKYYDSDDWPEEDEREKRREKGRAKAKSGRADVEEIPKIEVKEPDVALSDLHSIQIRRVDILKWAFKPFFKDTVIGCVARLGLGADQQTGRNSYRLVVIKDVVEVERAYKLEADFWVNTELQLQHGKATKNFRMQTISNEAVAEDEFKRWKATLDYEKQRMMTMREVDRKRKDIHRARSHTATHEEITQELAYKRQFNIIAPTLREKEVLNRLVDDAQTNNKPEIAARYQQQLERLELALTTRTQELLEKSRHLDQINEANRMKNWEDSRTAELAAQRAKKAAGSNDLDPFARRRTITSRMLGKEKSPSKSPSLQPQRSPNLPASMDQGATSSRDSINVTPHSSSPLSSSKLRPPSMSPLPASRVDSLSSKTLSALRAPSSLSASMSNRMMSEDEEINGSNDNSIITPSTILNGSNMNGNVFTTAPITKPIISVTTTGENDDSFLDSLDL